MKMVIHKAETRGSMNHGWLDAKHSFSFAQYYNPERTNFGVLRVLNDDRIGPGGGFGMHPHENMEIISIPLSGALRHKDNMGNQAVIRQGEIQVMSAGTGVYHSEYNNSQVEDVTLMQIWLFPNRQNVTPRYDQISLAPIQQKNELYQVLSPNQEDQGVWIYQDAWFHMGEFEEPTTTSYAVQKKENGLYVFIIEGAVQIEKQDLISRDAIGIWDTSEINITASAESKILIMDLPMSLN